MNMLHHTKNQRCFPGRVGFMNFSSLTHKPRRWRQYFTMAAVTHNPLAPLTSDYLGRVLLKQKVLKQALPNPSNSWGGAPS